MTVVIDIGCARYGNDYSMERLIEEFSPDILFGFDPNPEITVSAGADWQRLNPDEMLYRTPSGCDVYLEQKAAWTYDGEIGYRSETLNSWVTELKGSPLVPCFDLADFIYRKVPATKDGRIRNIVLKIDAEGSEYDLLRHLIARGMDHVLHFTWVEWHEPDRGRSQIEEEWDGTIEEWRW